MTLTLSIIAVTAIISVVAWQKPLVLNKLIYNGPAVNNGEWWRLVSHGFLHSNGNHLLFNMITLFFFGRIIEQVLVPRIGIAGYILFYLVGIIVSILPTHLKHRHNPRYFCLGASGAVSAILFAFIFLKPWAMLYVMFVPVPAIVFAVLYTAYSFWSQKYGKTKVNHSAHLMGAIWGVALLLFLKPSLFEQFIQKILEVPF